MILRIETRKILNALKLDIRKTDYAVLKELDGIVKAVHKKGKACGIKDAIEILESANER